MKLGTLVKYDRFIELPFTTDGGERSFIFCYDERVNLCWVVEHVDVGTDDDPHIIQKPAGDEVTRLVTQRCMTAIAAHYLTEGR